MIYINGCSFARLSDGKNYGEHLQDMGRTVYNASVTGSSVSRIIRTTLRDLSILRKQQDDITALITMTFPMRTELWLPEHTQNQFRTRDVEHSDGDFISVQFNHDPDWFEKMSDKKLNIKEEYKEYALAYLTWYNEEASMVTFYQNLVMLTSWLKHSNIKYVINTGPTYTKINLASAFIKTFADQIVEDPAVLNFYNNSFCRWIDQNGTGFMDDHTHEVNGIVEPCGHANHDSHHAWAKHLVNKYEI